MTYKVYGEHGKKDIALERKSVEEDRLLSPSAQRNRDIIRECFHKTMPSQGTILEIASGSGEHGVHIASSLPDIYWHGGDPDEASQKSLAAWTQHLGLKNMHKPHSIDVRKSHWGEVENMQFDGMMSANMIHITPFEACIGLFAGAGRLLKSEGLLFLYGPFKRNGEHTATSNQSFDESLKLRDAQWGVRDLEIDIEPLAKKDNLVIKQIIPMPANNLAVLFEKSS